MKAIVDGLEKFGGGWSAIECDNCKAIFRPDSKDVSTDGFRLKASMYGWASVGVGDAALDYCPACKPPRSVKPSDWAALDGPYIIPSDAELEEAREGLKNIWPGYRVR